MPGKSQGSDAAAALNHAASYNSGMTATRSDTPKRRLRLRFGLRTLLVFMLLMGVVFGVLGSMAYEAKRQRQVVADLREASEFRVVANLVE